MGLECTHKTLFTYRHPVHQVRFGPWTVVWEPLSNSVAEKKMEMQTGYFLRFKMFFASFLDLGFPCGLAGKESACNAGDLGSIPALGRSPGEEKGYPLQYSGLENSMDCIVHGVKKSQTRLSDFHFHWLKKKIPSHFTTPAHVSFLPGHHSQFHQIKLVFSFSHCTIMTVSFPIFHSC